MLFIVVLENEETEETSDKVAQAAASTSIMERASVTFAQDTTFEREITGAVVFNFFMLFHNQFFGSDETSGIQQYIRKSSLKNCIDILPQGLQSFSLFLSVTFD